jgi:NAD(P)-dependent dehydrogenase (short-subunit alcohol dehydrogenase family)
LAGKIALVTGGTSGPGLATAKRFVSEGAKGVVTGRREAELAAAVEELGGSAFGVQDDVSSLSDLDRLYATIRDTFGRLDVLFANAGGGAFVPLGEVTEAHFDKYFDVNVKGTLFTVQKALPLMAAGGSIVLNGSMGSVKGVPGFTVYAATKAALRSFARTWAVDLRGRNIRVNVVSPGVVVTPAYKNELGLSDEQVKEFEAQGGRRGAARAGRNAGRDYQGRGVPRVRRQWLRDRGRPVRGRRSRPDLAAVQKTPNPALNPGLP